MHGLGILLYHTLWSRRPVLATLVALGGSIIAAAYLSQAFRGGLLHVLGTASTASVAAGFAGASDADTDADMGMDMDAGDPGDDAFTGGQANP